MSLVVFRSHSTRFEMAHPVVSRSTRTRLLFGKLVHVVDCAIFLTESIRILLRIAMLSRAPQIKNYCWRTYTTLSKVGYAGLIIVRERTLITPLPPSFLISVLHRLGGR